jgi:hypothetical protein
VQMNFVRVFKSRKGQDYAAVFAKANQKTKRIGGNK